MTAIPRNITIEQGATFVLHFQWLEPGVDAVTPGDPHDLTGWIVRMQIRKKQADPILVDATTVNGKIVLGADNNGGAIDPTNGWIKVTLTDDDTDLLTTKSAKYDLEAEDTLGNVYRILQGSVTVDPNITQEVDDPPVDP